MRKTVLEVDLVGYSDVAGELEENLSPGVVMRFNDQIQGFVDAGLKAANVSREDTVFATTGDGAILVFDSPPIAHVAAAAVHGACLVHNHTRTTASAKRWFRIGIATGDVTSETTGGTKRIAGSVIARAVRLETACKAGEILVDTETYAGLSREQKALYGAEEQARGKRDEIYLARRCVIVPDIGAGCATAEKATPISVTPRRTIRKLAALMIVAVLIAVAISVWFSMQIRLEIDRTELDFGPGGPNVMTHISGRVRGVAPENVRIVVYAFDQNWYVQPYAGDVLKLDDKGRWRALVHRGLSYSVLLVRSDFKPESEVFAHNFVNYASRQDILAKLEINEDKLTPSK